MESEKDKWLEARIAAPVSGTLSKPLTHGLNNSFRTGPRKILFMTQ